MALEYAKNVEQGYSNHSQNKLMIEPNGSRLVVSFFTDLKNEII